MVLSGLLCDAAVRFYSGGCDMANFVTGGTGDVDMSVDYGDVVRTLDRLVYAKMVEAKDIRKVFRKVLTPVRKAVQNAARQNLGTDPREAWKGVRVITLKKGAGAVVGLLNPYKRGAPTAYQKPRGGRSGITRNRAKSDLTVKVEGYQGKDRAWILRIVNQGTEGRYAGTRGTLKKRAYRGAISAKKFFGGASGAAMKQAEAALAKELGKIIDNVQKKE